MLDPTDIKLLQILEADADKTVKELASSVGLAMSSTHDRIKSLRKRGLLRGTHADVDETAFGVQIQALLFVRLARQRRDVVDGLLDELNELPYVRSAFHVTGHFDIVVHLLARDMKDLQAVELDYFNVHPAIARVETSIIFDQRRRFSTPYRMAD